MSDRVVNTVNTKTSQHQKSPIIVVVQDNRDVKLKTHIKTDGFTENKAKLVDNEQSSSDTFHEQITFFENENESNLVWTRGNRATEFDANATEYFLQLRASQKYRKLFDSGKYGKTRLWGQIAEEMNDAGYYVGEGKEAAERCRQKFSNLEKSVLNYMRHISSPGNKKRDPPQFYEFLVDLVDYENKLYRTQTSIVDKVRDNLEVEMTTDDDGCLSSQERPEEEHDVHKTTEDSTECINSNNENAIISLLSKQHAEIVQLQREYLDKLDKYMAIQNEQRERMINSFIEAMRENPNCECRGRKRKSPSVESD